MVHAQAFLLDIEGTTTPVDFVFKTLFPYAREQLNAFLAANFDLPAVRDAVGLLRAEHESDVGAGADLPAWQGDPVSVEAYCRWLMDRDRKSTGLKALQGMIWQAGYESGKLKSVVYSDVVSAFARWKDLGKGICIYSSGSILAQKLLFAHTQAGDLTGVIDSYFDTTTGPKREVSSYQLIAKQMGVAPQEICFLSDVVEELDAASVAGFATFLVLRDGAKLPQGFNPQRSVANFNSL